MTTTKHVQYISIKTLRERFELGRWAAYRLIEQEGFPLPFIVGQEYRYPEAEVYKFVDARRAGASNELAARRRKTQVTAAVAAAAGAELPDLGWAS
jgi:predicted DNA-binding transcriptional regulator AlpA